MPEYRSKAHIPLYVPHYTVNLCKWFNFICKRNQQDRWFGMYFTTRVVILMAHFGLWKWCVLQLHKLLPSPTPVCGSFSPFSRVASGTLTPSLPDIHPVVHCITCRNYTSKHKTCVPYAHLVMKNKHQPSRGSEMGALMRDHAEISLTFK